MQRDFLWGGIGEEHKFHLVNWHTVCEPIKKMGLVVRKLLVLTKPLLGKGLWCYPEKKDMLWSEVIDKKYGAAWGEWYSDIVRGPYGVCLWENIWHSWNSLGCFIRFVVVNGIKIRFWYD